MEGILAIILAAGLMVTGKAGRKEGLIIRKTGNHILKKEAEATGGISAVIEGLGKSTYLHNLGRLHKHLAKLTQLTALLAELLS